MIEARDVSKWFGRVGAVRGVSFLARQGLVTGLLGPNGAGKTTLIRIITGYLSPSAGTVLVSGRDTLEHADAARRAIGYLPEAAPLYPEMSVEGYLRYRAGLYGLRGRAALDAVNHAIDRCWLPAMRSRRIAALSKGYRQRVGLAAALLHHPSILVLDEPTSGLDPTQIREMRALVRELAHDRTVLLSSHILPEVEQTCDSVLIVARGRKLADGTPADLLAPLRDAAPYFVEFTPGTDPAASRRALDAIPGVASIDADPAPTGAGPRWRLSPAPGAGDLREPIARAAASAGLLVVELSRSTPTLEHLFVRVIAQADEPAPDTAPAPASTPPATGAAA